MAGIFVSQVLLVFLLSSRPPASVASAVPPGRVYLVTQPVTEPCLISELWLEDPAEIALVSTRGFSGPLWRQLPRLEPGWLPWADPPHWLTQDLNRLAAVGMLSSPAALPSSLAAPAPPKPFVGTVPPPPASALPHSTVRVEGDLAKRRRLDSPQLPAWSHHDVLAPTTVQLMVDRDGVVLSATLLTRSGLPAADQKALELARAAQFEPTGGDRSGPPLTWGHLLFQWQVVPPGANVP